MLRPVFGAARGYANVRPLRAGSKEAMKMTFYRITLLCLACTLSCSTATHKPTDKDTSDIISLSLQRAVVAGEIPDYHLIKDKQNIVISAEGINPNLLPQLPGIHLVLLNDQQLQEKADAEELVFFLRFRSLEIAGDQAEVILDNIQATGKRTKQMGFGGSMTIEYRKENGNWVGKVKSLTVAFDAVPAPAEHGRSAAAGA
jgi:hypothetical protein